MIAGAKEARGMVIKQRTQTKINRNSKNQMLLRSDFISMENSDLPQDGCFS